MPQEIRCRNRQRLARLSNLNPRHTSWNFAGSLLFAGNRHSASLDGVLNELVSVGLCSMQRKEECAQLHFSRITGDLPNLQALAGCGQSSVHILKYIAQPSTNCRSVSAGWGLSSSVKRFRGGVL